MILYVLRYYPTLTETFVARELGELARRGIPVTVAALGERADGALQDELPPVPVLRPPRGLSDRRWSAVIGELARGRQEVSWLRAHQRPKDVARALWLSDEARRLGVRRVHAHFAGEAAEVARCVARRIGVPYSVTVHAVDLFRPRPSLGQVLADAEPVVTIAEHHRRWIERAHGKEAVVVRMGVPVERFGPSERTLAEGPLVAACVARYVPKKGIDTVLQVVDGLGGAARLRLVSDAPAHLASAWVDVGPLPPSQVPAALAQAQVFVLPCRVDPSGDRDGIPIALIEAMAAGLPVITTPVSGIGELVDEAVGWLVPPDDPAALTAALQEAMDPDERRRRGEAARQRIVARNLTVEAQVDDLLRAWGDG